MDEAPSARGATVSLPQTKKLTSPEGFTLDDSEDLVSKPIFEEMFKEELQMRSVPKVTVPRNPRYGRHVYIRAPYNMDGRVTELEAPTVVDSASIQEFNMKDLYAPRREGLYVHIPHLKLVRRFIRRNNGSRKPSARPFAVSRPTDRLLRMPGPRVTHIS